MTLALQHGVFWVLQVTKVKLKQKQQEGIAEARSGRRSPVSLYFFQQRVHNALQSSPRAATFSDHIQLQNTTECEHCN